MPDPLPGLDALAGDASEAEEVAIPGVEPGLPVVDALLLEPLDGAPADGVGPATLQVAQPVVGVFGSDPDDGAREPMVGKASLAFEGGPPLPLELFELPATPDFPELLDVMVDFPDVIVELLEPPDVPVALPEVPDVVFPDVPEST